ncbi:chaplin [Actinacidiphila sp. ITFR-21]|uniref:chaplin n=1 Tax=Actinacidiphila sp. ITFR-21 TaxID=3075199 RepID=UPI002889B6C7|nr:chaplin [Streptomyces sp. ITFR-21]WNI14529.1 chaplin [Streptomyces sp. ITFR-21]
MNRVARKGLVTAMVAGGVLASAGYAQADATAGGDTVGSPGVLSGNAVQVPVEIPVNACGNSINVVGLLNPAFGNSCANVSASPVTPAPARPGGSAAAGYGHPAAQSGSAAVDPGGPRRAGSSPAGALSSGGGARAAGSADGSAGILSGNGLGLPIHLPANLSGNSVDVVGIGNPVFGNTAVNGQTPPPAASTPAPPPHQPIPAPPADTARPPRSPAPAPIPAQSLAHTGSDGVGWTAAGGAGLLLGGSLLYRRFRPGRG